MLSDKLDGFVSSIEDQRLFLYLSVASKTISRDSLAAHMPKTSAVFPAPYAVLRTPAIFLHTATALQPTRNQPSAHTQPTSQPTRPRRVPACASPQHLCVLRNFKVPFLSSISFSLPSTGLALSALGDQHSVNSLVFHLVSSSTQLFLPLRHLHLAVATHGFSLIVFSHPNCLVGLSDGVPFLHFYYLYTLVVALPANLQIEASRPTVFFLL